MERAATTYDNNKNDDLNLKATELRIGLPGTDEPEREKASPNSSRTKKRSSSDMACSSSSDDSHNNDDSAPAKISRTTTQVVVGWPPVRSYRKNVLQANESPETGCGIYVKVSMDGAPYLRKIDLKVCTSYPDLVKGLEKMFKCSNICVYSEREGNMMNNGSDYAPTYEDKDGDWMLAGDVPWEMFVNNCNRLRLMKLKDLKLN